MQRFPGMANGVVDDERWTMKSPGQINKASSLACRDGCGRHEGNQPTLFFILDVGVFWGLDAEGIRCRALLILFVLVDVRLCPAGVGARMGSNEQGSRKSKEWHG